MFTLSDTSIAHSKIKTGADFPFLHGKKTNHNSPLNQKSMIQGISHMTFIVNDLEKMSDFLIHIFDAKEVYSSGEKTFSHSREKFFLIGGIWIAIMEGESLKEGTYNHVAFTISEEEYDDYLTKVTKYSSRLLPPRPRVEGEGRSIYFYDYDNHLFELHTGTLEQRLESYTQ